MASRFPGVCPKTCVSFLFCLTRSARSRGFSIVVVGGRVLVDVLTLPGRGVSGSTDDDRLDWERMEIDRLVKSGFGADGIGGLGPDVGIDIVGSSFDF